MVVEICSEDIVYNTITCKQAYAWCEVVRTNCSLNHDRNVRAVDDKYQMSCLSKLYGKESAWNPNAVNGSHYGIPQGRSEYLKTATAEEQIQWGLKYIDNRYGSPCAAWAFFQKNNYH